MSIKHKKSTPYCPAVMTEEQLKQQDWKFSMYDKYGIPYGDFDGPKSAEADLFSSQKNIDQEAARSFIMQSIEPSGDLAYRLLQYKKEEAKNEK